MEKTRVATYYTNKTGMPVVGGGGGGRMRRHSDTVEIEVFPAARTDDYVGRHLAHVGRREQMTDTRPCIRIDAYTLDLVRTFDSVELMEAARAAESPAPDSLPCPTPNPVTK